MHIAYLALIELDVSNACSIHTREMSEQLAALGHEVTLILPRPLHRQTWQGVRHVWVRWWGFDRSRQWAFFVESAWRVWRLHNRQRIDVLYVREMNEHPFLPWLARWLGVSMIVEVNGWVLDDFQLLGASQWKLHAAHRRQRKLFNASHGIVVSTIGNAQKVTRHYGIPQDRVLVQELGTNTEHFRPGDRKRARRDIGIPLEGLVILFAGSFHPHHDLGTLLDAFSQLVRQDINAWLVLVGQGTQRESIQRWVEGLGMASHVRMEGACPYEKIPTYFHAADIGVVPLTGPKIRQQQGALASKLWDYMACRLPVVVTDFPDTPSASLLADKAYVVPPEDANTMATALIDLLRNSNRRSRLGAIGYEYVCHHRTWRHAAVETSAFMEKRVRTMNLTENHPMLSEPGPRT